MAKASKLDAIYKLIGVVILGIFILLALWKIPQCQLSSKKLSSVDKQAEMENAYRATLVQALGGAFFFVTVYVTWRNLEVAEENLKVTKEKQATDRLVAEANLKATEEKQVTERFSKAIELLGSGKLEVRLGGIYALGRIAKDSSKDHWTIMEVLTSFIQNNPSLSQNTQKTGEQSGSTYPLQGKQKIATDVQAALTVIGRRGFNKEQDGQRIELARTKLKGANLINANLINANLINADLTNADLTNANLTDADLIDADLTNANLTDADLTDADLTNANLSRVNLTRVKLINTVINDTGFAGVYSNQARDEFEEDLQAQYEASQENNDYYQHELAINTEEEKDKYEFFQRRGNDYLKKAINTAKGDPKLPDYLQQPKSSQSESPEFQKP